MRPELVVNGAGPWIDDVNAALGAPSKMIGGTKGSHILLKNDELVRHLGGRMVYFEADDGRICLVFDYLSRALVGSTDTKADNPDTVRCEQDEVEYFLASVRALMPGVKVDRDQIVYAYSGIRPLPASDASIAGLISRDHSAPVTEPDPTRPFAIISLIGGQMDHFPGLCGGSRRYRTEAARPHPRRQHPRDADRRRQGFSSGCKSAVAMAGAGIGLLRNRSAADRHAFDPLRYAGASGCTAPKRLERCRSAAGFA